ncbi:MAG: EF-P lysine aminoacylase EpmA [Halofilum sp. (in: g-proteobacteria)]|nr:EF-P lysine aminoacylase EpmA [Halofilum sp. (in: g-proteobacteria)]
MSTHDWGPAASVGVLALRGRMRARIRAFFDATGALEVDTPALSAAAPTEPHLHPLATRVSARRDPLYLQTSPEFPMKRLLAAGTGDCWQLCRVFRDRERGRHHNPEFDLLEWYRVGADHHELMDDVEALVAAAIGPELSLPGAERLSYAEAFRRHAGIDPFSAGLGELQELAAHAHLEPLAGLASDDRQDLLDRLLAGAIAPAFPADRPTFVYDWPAAQAALARLDPGDARIARRFELYWGALELANGFHELTDAAAQRARFEAERAARGGSEDARAPLDERLLAALEHGLPDCAGVALGFDRLVMVAAGARHIDEVLAFPLERA